MRHGFGDGRRGAPQNTGMRLGGMVALLIVIGLLYTQAKRPETWKWLANDDRDAAQAVNSETEPTTTATRTAETARSSAAPRAADISPGMRAMEAAKKGSSTASTNATGTAAPTSTAEVAVPTPTTTAAATFGTETASMGSQPGFRDTVIPGPTDLDPEEKADAQGYFELIADRKELHEKTDMGSYWRLFRWTWAQSFEELEKRAQRQVVLFQQLGETPQKYRGTPIRLRLHVKQIVKWDAPENRGNFKHIYEIWGATDDSIPFPYVVVVSELPPNMKIGANLRHEGVFVGYFLKNMSYRAHDVPRWAPLLVGRMHWQKDSAAAMREATDTHVLWQWLAGAGLAVMVGVWAWLRFSRLNRPAPAIPATAEADMEAWFGDSPTTSVTPGPSFNSPPTEAIDPDKLEIGQNPTSAHAATPDRDESPPKT